MEIASNVASNKSCASRLNSLKYSCASNLNSPFHVICSAYACFQTIFSLMVLRRVKALLRADRKDRLSLQLPVLKAW